MAAAGTVFIAVLGVIGGLWSIYEMWQKALLARAARDRDLPERITKIRKTFETVIRQGGITIGELTSGSGPDDQWIRLKHLHDTSVRNRRLRYDIDLLLTYREAMFNASAVLPTSFLRISPRRERDRLSILNGYPLIVR